MPERLWKLPRNCSPQPPEKAFPDTLATMNDKVLVIACGAIAKELVRIQALNQWDHIEFQCLPPELHNTPDQIPDAVKDKIESQSADYRKIFIGYADCGTGGLLDKVLQEYQVERIPGAHCYEFFAGSEDFHALAEDEPGSFYLTDFLVKHFERLVIKGLAMDRLPQLIPVYFNNYQRVVYLAQTQSDDLQAMARKQAKFLGLEYHYRYFGDQPFAQALKPLLGQ
jgi:hypothetical protein